MTVTPTATDKNARAKAKAAILKNGGTHVLRQPIVVETQTGPGAGGVASSPLSASSAVVVDAANTGASAVKIAAAGATGLLVAGDVLTFAGHSTRYIVTGGPYAPNPAQSYQMTPAITPALTAAVAPAEAVSVAFSGTDKLIKGVRSMIETKFVDGEVTRTGDWQILFSTLDLESRSITIREGNDLYLGDNPATSPLAEVLRVARIPSGEQDAALWVFAREVRR